MHTDILATHSVKSDCSFAGSLFLSLLELRLDPPSDIDSLPRTKPVGGPFMETKLTQFEG